jgi:hypothetical protein
MNLPQSYQDFEQRNASIIEMRDYLLGYPQNQIFQLSHLKQLQAIEPDEDGQFGYGATYTIKKGFSKLMRVNLNRWEKLQKKKKKQTLPLSK